jgi:uncharacterized protein (TIGR00106 family)
MAMMEISIVPLGTKGTSLSRYVAAIHKVLRRRKGVAFELGGMSTLVTGPPERLFQLAAELHRIPFSKGARRVYTVLKMDDRRDQKATPQDKVRSVLKKI